MVALAWGQDKLNVWDIDKVREVLRGLFQEERTILLEDVEYLTSLLDEETELQVIMLALTGCVWYVAWARACCATFLLVCMGVCWCHSQRSVWTKLATGRPLTPVCSGV